MFEQQDWIIACMDCKTLINLKEDRCQNIIDYQGKIIKASWDAIQELIEASHTINIRFPLIEQIDTFLSNHRSHQLRSGIFDEELKEFSLIQLEQKPLQQIEFTCHECNLKSPKITTYTDNQILQKKFAAKELELYYTILELYNATGMRINNHKVTLELEHNLPFLKMHCTHNLSYKTV